MTASSQRDRAARVAIARLDEPGDKTLAALVRDQGHERVLAELRSGRPHQLAIRLRPRLDRTADIDDDAIARALHATILTPADPQWPHRLGDLEWPPHCLWVRGERDLNELCVRSVALVGARAATPYGLDQAATLAMGLVARGFTILSGAAFGIDGAAHRGALAAAGRTVAVLACGIDRAYPLAHADLLGAILDQDGAVVTELPPGAAPYRRRFLERNRLIAALTAGTVVVEAALRSGSLSTAGEALTLSRPVGAVPGPVTSMSSAGCHRWIRDQMATLVTDAAEVADLVGAYGDDAASPSRGVTQPPDDLPPLQRQVWEVLPVRAFAALESLADRAALGELEVASGLGQLEARGMAQRDGDRWRRSRVAT